jgi:hypothetical protein
VNERARTEMHDSLFPTGVVLAETLSSSSSASEAASERDELAPEDCPPGTARYYLTRLMTSTDLTLKRLAAEYLYEVCGQNSKFAPSYAARGSF